MSIQSQITRISGNVSDALSTIEGRGVTIPSGSNSDDLSTLIAQIEGPETVNLINGKNYVFSDDGEGNITITEDSGSGVVLTTKTITANGTYSAEDDSADGYSSVTVNVPGITPTGTVSITENGTTDVTNYASASVNVQPDLQAKSVTPSESSQVVTPDSDKDGLSQVTVGAIPSQYIVPSGALTISENGTYDVTGYASAEVETPPAMNVQMYNGYDYVSATSYTDTDVTLTVEVSGTYDISWVGWRNTTSGTSGSQLYKNGSALNSAATTFQGSYGQSVNLTGVSLSAGDVLVVRARSRSTSYRMYVANLVIVQTV